MEPADRDAFTFPGTLVEFRRSADDSVVGLTVSTARVFDLRFAPDR